MGAPEPLRSYTFADFLAWAVENRTGVMDVESVQEYFGSLTAAAGCFLDCRVDDTLGDWLAGREETCRAILAESARRQVRELSSISISIKTLAWAEDAKRIEYGGAPSQSGTQSA